MSPCECDTVKSLVTIVSLQPPYWLGRGESWSLQRLWKHSGPLYGGRAVTSARNGEMELRVVKAAGGSWLPLRTWALREPHAGLRAPAGTHRDGVTGGQITETKKGPSLPEPARHLEGRETLIPSLKILPEPSAIGLEKMVKSKGEEEKLLAGRWKKSNPNPRAGAEWMEEINTCGS